MTGVVSCRVYLVSEMTYNVLSGTLNSTIPYLVGAGERKYNDSDHQVSDGQRHNELVGRHATQFAVSEDGHDDHHVAMTTITLPMMTTRLRQMSAVIGTMNAAVSSLSDVTFGLSATTSHDGQSTSTISFNESKSSIDLRYVELISVVHVVAVSSETHWLVGSVALASADSNDKLDSVNDTSTDLRPRHSSVHDATQPTTL